MVAIEDASVTSRRGWTHHDFEVMSFHDVRVYAMAFRENDDSGCNFGFLLDVDWIVEWLCDPVTRICRFAVAPATLVFDDASGLRFEGKPPLGALFELDTVTRTPNPRIEGAAFSTWRWRLVGHDGAIELDASGFRLQLRRPPVVGDAQQLPMALRGGISLEVPRPA